MKRRSRSRRARESSSSSDSESPSSSSSSSDSDTSNRVSVSISKSVTTVLNPKRLEKKILKLEKQIDELVLLKEESKKRDERKKITKDVRKLEKKKDETIMKILSSGPEVKVQISSKKTPPLRVHVSRRSDSKRNSLVTCPDTGANRSMAPERVVKELNMEKHIDRSDNRYSVKNASGDKMRIIGSIWLWIHVKDSPHPVRVHFIVAPDLTETLVGCGNLISLGVLPRGFPQYLGSDNAMHTTEDESEDSSKKEEDEEVEFSHIQHESVRKTLTDFSSVFRNRLSKSTRLDTEPMRIELRDDVTIRPLGVSTARLIPARWQDEADEMIRNLLKSRIIGPAGKAGGWCSPSKFVAKPGAPCKPDGTPRLRHVVDYTHLNRYVRRPYQAFPTPAEIRKSLPGEVRFMVQLDCLSAYNQLTLDPEHRPLTAFLYHGKRYSDRYQYRCAPMGLSSSSDNWIKAINKILEPCRPWLKQEVDDILITASSLDELNARLRV